MVKERIADALVYGNGEYELTDILKALLDRDMQLWIDESTAAVTTIIRYPRKTTCLILAAGGDLDVLRRDLPLVEAWAKENGCDAMEVMGRKGWLRALPDYEQAQVHVRKDL